MSSFFKFSIAILILSFSFSLEAGKKRKPKGKGKPPTVAMKQKAPDVGKNEKPPVGIPQSSPASLEVKEEPVRRSPSPPVQEKTPEWTQALEKLFLPNMTGPQKFMISQAAKKWTPEEIEAHANLLNANQDWLFPQDFPDDFRHEITHQSLRYRSEKFELYLSQMKEQKECLFNSFKSKDASFSIVVSALENGPAQVAALISSIIQYEEVFFPERKFVWYGTSFVMKCLLKGDAGQIQTLGASGLFDYVNINASNRENLIKAAFQHNPDEMKIRAEAILGFIKEVVPHFPHYYGQLVTHLLECDVVRIQALHQCKSLFDGKYVDDELKVLSLVKAIPQIDARLLRERTQAIITHQDVLFQGTEKVFERIDLIEDALNIPAENLRERAQTLHQKVMPHFNHPGLIKGRKIFIFGQLLRYPSEKVLAQLLVIQSAISAGFETPGFHNPDYAYWGSHVFKKKIQDCLNH